MPPKGLESEVNVIDTDCRCVNVINLANVCYTNGTVFELPSETIKAVDKYVVPKDFQTSGCRKKSFLYFLGVYVNPVYPNDRRHKYVCKVTSFCRTKKTAILCKNGDRSPVNSRHKKSPHTPRGTRRQKGRIAADGSKHPPELRVTCIIILALHYNFCAAVHWYAVYHLEYTSCIHLFYVP